MRIIVIADTHSAEIPRTLTEEIKNADCVIHAGDFTDAATLQSLRKAKEVHAVYGNMDGLDLRQVLPCRDIWQCEGVRIGIFHGEGSPQGLPGRIREYFKDDNVQAVVFGHTHEAFNQVVDGVLLFNPGSPTDNVRPEYRSYGVLEVKGGQIKGQIVKLK